MKQRYQDFKFKNETLRLIDQMNSVVRNFVSQGFRLTVRQLYYQLVAGGHIPNTEKSYKKTTGIVNDARLAGLMDWDAIEDRTREFISRPNWDSPASILRSCAQQFHMDMWADQPARVFAIVEKEALAGVLEPVCRECDIPLLAARGYPSVTVLREFALERINPHIEAQDIIILHLGDHDPSGIDMSRDLQDRLSLFCGGAHIDFRRIALNMDQIEEQAPPPNPAKVTDSRFTAYQQLYGDESWELDALTPTYLSNLIRDEIEELIDTDAWDATQARIDEAKDEISNLAERLQ